MLLQEFVDHTHEQHAEDDGEHGAVVADGRDGDAEEVQALDAVDAGVEQDRTEERAEVGVALELRRDAVADEDGQEPERRLVDAVDDLVGAGILRDAEEVCQKRQHRACETAGDQHGDDGRERAADEGHRGVEVTSLLRLRVRLERLVVLDGAAALEVAELDELLMERRDVLTDDVLVLAVLHDEVEHARHRLARSPCNPSLA